MQASANSWAWKYSTILPADQSEMNASETDIPLDGASVCEKQLGS